ncbi:putative DNA polymerase epsilon subunit A [Tieghemostelium lacteum]|uniref:DNA polymerase epsilon catalytic subunit n=1 Tax=Tieghemostelium lacteum TaxID=361077 RepID=A0A151ZBC5_TIELA|nr:putative DNA polymerase epsilon subunit A [Tieghemostelium lacteum]|eukprot:KYQ91238.1 putative DNA polymerase epsilon subunit A [Tieghemostelium lacteum]
MSQKRSLYKEDKSDSEDEKDKDEIVDKFDNQQNDNEEQTKFYKHREGWLVNMQPSSWKDKETGLDKSSLELFFIQEDANAFKAWVPFNPYFYIYVKDGHQLEVEGYLKKTYESKIASIDILDKEDLDLDNHLSGLKRKYLKIRFHNVQTLVQIRNELNPIIKQNKQKSNTSAAYEDPLISKSYYYNSYNSSNNSNSAMTGMKKNMMKSATEHILDLREYDVPYYVRAAIDLDIRVGLWYKIERESMSQPPKVIQNTARVDRPDPRVLAFDIETTKAPLMFPDSKIDCIMMISYMLDRQGYLIVNREIVSQDIEDFEYNPKPEYEGPFTVFNEPDEKSLLQKFFSHIRQVKPHIFVTFNGDSFDWPFVEARASYHELDMQREIGFRCDAVQGECKSRNLAHMDAFCWVKRDSYLPHGSHGLKAVTREKLQYDPLEIDPEDMIKFAQEDPHRLANYSVSDAVATYYLYMTYVHPFIFSLCTIIPMNPDDVLRKGSGTLCEALLMTQAFKSNIIYPNKHLDEMNKMYKGHLVESETYVGGHVECLESGVFRSDIPTWFNISQEALKKHIDNVENVIKFAMHEGGIDPKTVTNMDEIKRDVVDKFQRLHDQPKQLSNPLIYHLDVGAMYPNIILTNKLQPSAIVTEEDCASCVYNKPENKCQRTLDWEWRGDYTPSNHSEYKLILQQLESERFGPNNKPYSELDELEKQQLLKTRLKEYSRKVYKKTHVVSQEIRSDTVCMRENSFYVDTVRTFRDRRYVFKNLHRDWKIKYDQSLKESGGASSVAVQECQGMVVLYESLQLAHKCILNSFYGYVMRKGARWYSMQMAGIVTHTGSKIIKEAREVVEQLGRPLEIDTDGIWCILPWNFPENYTIKTNLESGKKFTFSYLCVMLNEKVAENFTNHQYQDYDPQTGQYTIRDECSILFECDGPYRCMVIPASKEKDVKLKKRYAVFNKQGRICELKGFEIKRRGELKLIKLFQSQVFEHFLGGNSLEGCYESVGSVANHWLDILDSHGEGYEEKDLIELITESSKMSRKLEEYGSQKSSAISTAKKLGEFLGPDMIKEKGLNCSYIVSIKPSGAAVTERTIPIEIFNAETERRNYYLRKWVKSNQAQDLDIRNLIDWEYYKQRLGGSIQKIITIPAALQNIANPVPRIIHPEWILKELRKAADDKHQTVITNFFQKMDPKDGKATVDIEDLFASRATGAQTQKRTLLDFATKDSKKKAKSTASLDILKEKAPSYDKDFPKWLEFKKEYWRAKRLKNKTKRMDGDNDDDDESLGARKPMIGKMNPKGVNFFQSQSDIIKRGIWNIISIEETNQPGIFQFWSQIDNKIIPLLVKIDRTFYLNSFQEDSPYEGAEKSNLVPPRSKPKIHLFKKTMTEQEYQERSKELNTLFTNPQIEGVYETQMSLEMKAIIQIGCMASLKRSSRSQSVTNSTRFHINDLVPYSKNTEKPYSYLAEHNFHQLYIYHNHNNRDGKDGMFCLLNLSLNQATIRMVNPYQKTPNLNSKLLNQIKERFPQIEFKLEQSTSMAQAYKDVNLALTEHQNQYRQTSIILLQTRNPQALYTSIPMLKQFARVLIPYHETDSQYSPFNWEVHALKPLTTRLSDIQKLWIYYVNMSRYANIPIGNIPSDSATFISDVLYSRALQDQNQILWQSDSNYPDLGGSEEDDAKFHEELSQVEINQPDSYNSVCIEFEISNLATNTILESSHLAEIEGILGIELNSSEIQSNLSSLFGSQQGTQSSQQTKQQQQKQTTPNISNQTTSCEKEFNILKNLVSKWKLDLVAGGTGKKNALNTEYSHYLLVHFYRWINSPHSKLYDPIIHRNLHNLMKKVFLQFIYELKKLGCKIIYGNFNKIIIHSQKTTIEDAEAYCKYIIQVIKKKELFSWISIKPTCYWYNLLWMDQSNYSGIVYCPSGKQQSSTIDGSQVLEDEPVSTDGKSPDKESGFIIPNGKIDAQWNISEFLPEQIKGAFLVIISDYIHKMHINKDQYQSKDQQEQLEQKKEKEEDILDQDLGLSQDSSQQSANNGETKGEKNQKRKFNLKSSKTWSEEDKEHSKEDKWKLSKYKLTVEEKRIYTFLTNFQNHPSLEFPVLPGSHLNFTNPALEFIKFTCHVLSIDKQIQSDIQRLRKNLMTFIQIREFSDDAKFKDPCMTYTLPDVICTFCHACRDLDLLRPSVHVVSLLNSTNPDGNSQSSSDSHQQQMVQHLLTCDNCHNQYAKEVIEATLVEIIQRRSMSYQLQDVKCSKCSNVKADNLSETCQVCSGQWRCKESKEVFMKDLTIFKNIAKYYKFEWLLEITESLSIL